MPEDLPDVYLRFEGFEGECRDANHLGKDGWITIKSFSFGFGFDGSDEEPDATPTNGAPGKPNSPGKASAAQKRKKPPPMKSGPMNFDPISFSKSSDKMSIPLMEACHQGKEIPVVELEACRYGGALGDEKLPFLHMTFEKVHLKTCKLNLATEGLPSEDIDFQYEKVHFKCLWTDNATGNRLTSQPIGVGWNLGGQKPIYDNPNDDDTDTPE